MLLQYDASSTGHKSLPVHLSLESSALYSFRLSVIFFSSLVPLFLFSYIICKKKRFFK